MEKRSVIKTGAKGTEYTYHFTVDVANDQLYLNAVTVKGQDITEVIDNEILQGVYNEQYQQWIMAAA